VTAPTLGFGRSTNGIDWGAADGPARLIFLIAAPAGGGAEHMNILAQLARRLVRESFRQSLLEAPDEQSVVDVINKEVLGQ
jgi:PTS system fructose-specific IIA component